MKRILVLMLVAIAMLMFVSCDNKAEESVPTISYEDLKKGTWYYTEGSSKIYIKFNDENIAKVSQEQSGSSTDKNLKVSITGDIITFKDESSNSNWDYRYQAVLEEGKLTLTKVGDDNMYGMNPNLKTDVITFSLGG